MKWVLDMQANLAESLCQQLDILALADEFSVGSTDSSLTALPLSHTCASPPPGPRPAKRTPIPWSIFLAFAIPMGYRDPVTALINIARTRTGHSKEQRHRMARQHGALTLRAALEIMIRGIPRFALSLAKLLTRYTGLLRMFDARRVIPDIM